MCDNLSWRCFAANPSTFDDEDPHLRLRREQASRSMSMGAENAAASEAIFRDVNERVVEIDRAHGVPAGDLSTFVCECSDSACLERVALHLAAYEVIRANPTWFVLVPGHETEEIERVVERHEGYVVVEKVGLAADVAREHDPRD